jgi:hypothetical protein
MSSPATATPSESPVTRRAHSLFSPGRIWILATHTMTQLLRMRILWFLAVFSVLMLALAFLFERTTVEQQLKQIKDWGLGAMHVSSIIFAIASTALLLPRDLEDRTLYTILSKPVPRYEYLIGKLLGVILLIGGALVFMDVVFSAVVWIKQTMMIGETVAAYQKDPEVTPNDIAAAVAKLQSYGLTWSVHAEVWMAFLRASIVTALTLMISSFASTTLFTIITSMGFTVAGFGLQLVKDWLLGGPQGFKEKSIGHLMSILCPNLSLFNLAEPATHGVSVPLSMLEYLTGVALLYVLAYTFVCYLFFMDKEL